MKYLGSIALLFLLIGFSGYSDEKLYQSKEAAFYASISGGVSIPISDLSVIMQNGYTLRGYGAFLFQFEYFDVGLGGIIGVDFFSTRKSLPTPYLMLVFPLGVHSQISSKFGLPFRLFLEANAGVTLNSLFFHNDGSNINTFKIFLQVAFGIGNDISDILNFAQFIGLTVILFEDPVYVMLNPGLRIEVKF